MSIFFLLLIAGGAAFAIVSIGIIIAFSLAIAVNRRSQSLPLRSKSNQIGLTAPESISAAMAEMVPVSKAIIEPQHPAYSDLAILPIENTFIEQDALPSPVLPIITEPQINHYSEAPPSDFNLYANEIQELEAGEVGVTDIDAWISSLDLVQDSDIAPQAENISDDPISPISTVDQPPPDSGSDVRKAVPPPSRLIRRVNQPPKRRTVREKEFDSSTPAGQLEQKLREQFKSVGVIGQLPISQRDFDEICGILRSEFLNEKRPLYTQIPAALLMTSMVFTARYSKDEARNFWTPYAQLVWGIEKADLSFQNRFRVRFHSAASYLAVEFGFLFPRQKSGDVVRPLYRHAIIPKYLQDDFARWLKSRWQEILEIPPEVLLVQVRSDNSLHRLPRSLQPFFHSVETADAAAEILVDMANAARMYVQGESPDQINAMLVANPIEQALWGELLTAFEQQSVASNHKQAETLQWVWNLEFNEMQLRIMNLRVHKRERPSRFVWVAPNEEVRSAAIVNDVTYWDDNDDWLIDPVVMRLGPLNGKLVLVAEDSSVQYEKRVPALGNEPLIFFRSTQQDVYGVPMDIRSPSLMSGEWFISVANGVQITNEKNEPVQPRRIMPVPDPLRTHAGHTNAGLYELELPVVISRDGSELIRLERRDEAIGRPFILGTDGNQLEHLSPKVPPTFSDKDVWLVIPSAPRYLINRATLWLRAEDQTISKSLSSIQTQGDLTLTGDGDLHVYLGNLLPLEPGSWVVQVRVGIQPLFVSPLQLTVLPSIGLTPPNLIELHHPGKLPSCVITGIEQGQIIPDAGMQIKEVGNSFHITWSNLRNPPTVRLEIAGRRIPLMWDVKQIYAWLDPDDPDGIYEFEDLKRTLHIEGPISLAGQSIQMWIDSSDITGVFNLTAQGRYSNSLRQDRLFDMLRNFSGTQADVWLGRGNAKWKFIEVHKRPVVESVPPAPVPPVQLFPMGTPISTARSPRNNSLVMPTRRSRFFLDSESAYWKQHDLWHDLKELCKNYGSRSSKNTKGALIDWVDPVTQSLVKVDPLVYQIITECSQHPDFITKHTTLVDAIFRALLASGNRPLTIEELAQRTGRSEQLILDLLRGQHDHLKGIRVWMPSKEHH